MLLIRNNSILEDMNFINCFGNSILQLLTHMPVFFCASKFVLDMGNILGICYV